VPPTSCRSTPSRYSLPPLQHRSRSRCSPCDAHKQSFTSHWERLLSRSRRRPSSRRGLGRSAPPPLRPSASLRSRQAPPPVSTAMCANDSVGSLPRLRAALPLEWPSPSLNRPRSRARSASCLLVFSSYIPPFKRAGFDDPGGRLRRASSRERARAAAPRVLASLGSREPGTVPRSSTERLAGGRPRSDHELVTESA
jgi:hypothetical protein